MIHQDNIIFRVVIRTHKVSVIIVSSSLKKWFCWRMKELLFSIQFFFKKIENSSRFSKHTKILISFVRFWASHSFVIFLILSRLRIIYYTNYKTCIFIVISQCLNQIKSSPNRKWHCWHLTFYAIGFIFECNHWIFSRLCALTHWKKSSIICDEIGNKLNPILSFCTE